jgi:hypothetical protein
MTFSPEFGRWHGIVSREEWDVWDVWDKWALAGKASGQDVFLVSLFQPRLIVANCRIVVSGSMDAGLGHRGLAPAAIHVFPVRGERSTLGGLGLFFRVGAFGGFFGILIGG